MVVTQLDVPVLSPYANLPMSLRQLQYALAIAETGSFSRAAERCYVSQPGLSAQVQALEDALGVQIFERASRPVRPTTAGEQILAHARKVLAEVLDLQRQSAALTDPLARPLRIGIIPTLAPYLLPQTAETLRAHLPKLTPIWLEEKTPVLREQLEQGRVDAAILAVEAELGEVEVAEIGWDPFWFAAAKDHALAGDQPLPLSALEGLSMLLLDDGHCLRDQALSWCQSAGGREMALRATSLPTLVQMVAHGTGATLLPRLALGVENRAHQLAARPLAARVGRTVGLAWRTGSPLGPACRQIADILKTGLADVLDPTV